MLRLEGRHEMAVDELATFAVPGEGFTRKAPPSHRDASLRTAACAY